MTLVATQLLEGTTQTSGDSPSATLKFYVRDDAQAATDEWLVLACAKAASPATYAVDGFTLNRQGGTVENINHFSAYVTYSYGLVAFDTAPPPRYEFDTTGGNETMFVSLATVQSKLATGISGTVPDYKQAIGVSDNGAEGVSRVIPAYKFSNTYYLADAAVNSTFKSNLYAATGTVNNAAWNGYAAGELLFLGATGSFDGKWWQITYNFAAMPNATGVTIGPFTGITKAGWDYVWFSFEETEDTAAKRVIKKPIAIFVEQIYKRTAFGTLLY